MRDVPNNRVQRHGPVLASVLIIGILAAAAFLSTERFYYKVNSATSYESLLETVNVVASKPNYLRVQEEDSFEEDDVDPRDLPIANELFEGANDGNVNDDDDTRHLPIANELFEGANNSDPDEYVGDANDDDVNNTPIVHENPRDNLPEANELFEGGINEGEERVSIGKVYENNSISIDYQSVDHEDETTDDDDDDDVYYNIAKDIADADDDGIYDKISERISSILGKNENDQIRSTLGGGNGTTNMISPACHPHFNLALPNNKWNNSTKFSRIYFYHSRKAGGSSIHKYLGKVADHYNIKLSYNEWTTMEEPGTYDNATFYVTHMREPIDRSISHFKFQGRWDCRDLVRHSDTFTPTEANANKIQTWNHTGGHVESECKVKGRKKNGESQQFFFLGQCAVNCYTQWWSGVCKEMDVPLEQQYQIALQKSSRYNFIAVIEKLSDPEYVQAVEDFFGVPGLEGLHGTPYCQRQSHKANAKYPLVVPPETRESLTNLNQVDINLYHRLTDCLDSGGYSFPKFDANRFHLHSYNKTEAKEARKEAKAAKLAAKQAEKDTN